MKQISIILLVIFCFAFNDVNATTSTVVNNIEDCQKLKTGIFGKRTLTGAQTVRKTQKQYRFRGYKKPFFKRLFKK